MLTRYLLVLSITIGLASTVMASGSSSSSKSSKPSRPSTFAIAKKAVKAERYNDAIRLFKKVVARNSRNADAWNYLGFSNRKLKKFDQALKSYQKALAINPKHRGANEYLGELYLQTDKLANAKSQLKKLDDICSYGCDEYDDLKKAIKTFEAAHKG